jgi:hypothetical protein
MTMARRQFMAGLATFGAVAVVAPGELLRPSEAVSLPGLPEALPEAAPGIVTLKFTPLGSAAWGDQAAPVRHAAMLEIDGLRHFVHFGEQRDDIIPGLTMDVMGWQTRGALYEPITIKVWGYIEPTLNRFLRDSDPEYLERLKLIAPAPQWNGLNLLDVTSPLHPLEISLPMGDLRLYPASLPAAL